MATRDRGDSWEQWARATLGAVGARVLHDVGCVGKGQFMLAGAGGVDGRELVICCDREKVTNDNMGKLIKAAEVLTSRYLVDGLERELRTGQLGQ